MVDFSLGLGLIGSPRSRIAAIRQAAISRAPRSRSSGMATHNRRRRGEQSTGLLSLVERIFQQVTWRIALVFSAPRFKCSMASSVGRMINSTLRRRASRLTSSITGSAPVPVPTTK